MSNYWAKTGIKMKQDHSTERTPFFFLILLQFSAARTRNFLHYFQKRKEGKKSWSIGCQFGRLTEIFYNPDRLQKCKGGFQQQRDKASNTISPSRDSAYTCHAVVNPIINSATQLNRACALIQEGPKGLHTPTPDGRRRLKTPTGTTTVHRDLNDMALAPYGDKEFFREAQPLGPCDSTTG